MPNINEIIAATHKIFIILSDKDKNIYIFAI